MLSVSEMFYSIQGEGKSIDTPSLFLRLQRCNLLCGNPDFTQITDKHNGKEIEKHKDEKAKWCCDTIHVWRHGKIKSTQQIIEEWQASGWYEKLKESHLVITGGEPLLQQEGLVKLLVYLPQTLYTEVETNATIMPSHSLDPLVNQYNCSPKLSNAQVSREKRYCTDVLEWFANNKKVNFKFVVLDEEDVNEIERYYIKPFNISPKIVYLMPGVSSRKELEEKSPLVQQLAEEHGFNYSTRRQLERWDRTTGV